MKTSKFFFSFTALLLSLLCSSLQASAYDYSDNYSSYYYDGTTEMEEALRKGHAAATLEDYVKAESYYLQASDLGSVEAQYFLGILYSDSSLTLYDPTKALYYLNESAKTAIRMQNIIWLSASFMASARTSTMWKVFIG